MIKVENLTKRYAGHTAIQDLSFEVGKGEIMGFLGPNGAGKSTTMRILSSFMPATSGRANGWVVYLIAYVVFIGVHLYGVGEALKLMFGITAIAVVALVAAVIGLSPKFSTGNLVDITPDGSTLSSGFLPYGISGVVAALVYGIWFFLAVEGVPARGGGDRGPEARHAPRPHHRDAGPPRVRGVHAARGPRGGRVRDRAHLGQPASGRPSARCTAAIRCWPTS